MAHRYFYHTNDKDGQLAHSHYSDPSFDGEGAVIFGKEENDGEGAYADRLQQWEPEKSDTAWKLAVKEHGDKRTARRIECYLQHYYDDPVLELLSIRSGTQPFSGYPWFYYGFKRGVK